MAPAALTLLIRPGSVQDWSNEMKDLLDRKSIRLLAIALFSGLLVVAVPIPFRILVLAFAALGWTLLEAGNLRPLGLGRHRLRPTPIWGLDSPSR